MSSELDSCPFCGGKAGRGSWRPSDTWSADVNCTKCPARLQVDCCDSDQGALVKVRDAWNKRINKSSKRR